jgi:hypothetical protein
MSSQVSSIAQSTGRGSNENYTLISGYDILDRDFYRKLIKKVPRASALKWMRSIDGYMTKRTAKRHEYYFHEEGQWFSTVCTIQAATDQTTFVRITLSSADHDNSGLDSYPRVGNTVVFNNEVVGYIRALSRSVAGAHTIDVYPADTTNVNVVAAAVVGTTFSVFSNAQKEKSTGVDTIVPKTTKVTNYIQTFREGYEVTDHAMQNHTEFEYNGRTNLYVKGMDDMMDRFEMAEELGLLINPASSGLTDANSNAIRLAKGLIPQITDSGNTLEYFGTPDMSTIDDAILILNGAYGENEYLVGQGIRLNLGWKNWLIDFNTDGDKGISYGSLTKEQVVALNFNAIHVEPYSFYMNTWALFGHPDSLGATGMPYPDMAVFIPMGKTKNPDRGDEGQDYEPYIQMVYCDPGGAPHENKGDHQAWSTGAKAPGGATNDEANWKIHVISYKGLEVRCRNKFLVMRKAA